MSDLSLLLVVSAHNIARLVDLVSLTATRSPVIVQRLLLGRLAVSPSEKSLHSLYLSNFVKLTSKLGKDPYSCFQEIRVCFLS